MSLEWEMACLSTRIVIPKQLRCQVLELAHEGHPGIVAMKQRLRTKVWWPGIDKEVEKEKKREKLYANCQRNARESEIREGDKVLLRQEKEKKLSTPHKQSPFTVIQFVQKGTVYSLQCLCK